MKIGHKLTAGFLGISALVGIVGAISINQQLQTAKKLAIREAEHVAETMATSITHQISLRKTDGRERAAIEYDLESLQKYIEDFHRVQHRDAEVVDVNKKILADVIPEDVGTICNIDPQNEIAQTLHDGITRTFLEKSEDYPEGAQQVVVPIRTERQKILGAIILEYTPLYEEAIAEANHSIVSTTTISFICVALAILLGILISKSISRPIQAVTQVAQQVTEESNFDLQAPITTQDEVGTLSSSINQLINRVKQLLEEQKVATAREATLIQSEKMSNLGRMVAGIAHEINNPVNFIYGNLSQANEYMNDLFALIHTYETTLPSPPVAVQQKAEEIDREFLEEDAPKLVQSMKVGAERVRQIVLSLRNFSRLEESEARPLDLHECLDSTLLILSNRIKKGITVERNYSDLPMVEGFSGSLYQVFMNILSNAIDALEDYNTQQTSEEIRTNPSAIRIWTELIQQQWVAIHVADNGPGMNEEIRAQLFEAFFSTKPSGKGTGLGLSISYQIVVEKHGGKLYCHSSPGKGTEFVIEIPIHQSVT
jgi:signal transduction histidine kinase